MSIGSIGGTYGLSGSGLDVDSIVKKLMSGEQAKEDALVQKKTVLQWKKEAYNTVYDDISDFRNTVFNYKLQSTLSPHNASSSNESVVTATANADASAVNHSLVVAQLADGVKLTSTAAISATQPPTLGTLSTQFGIPTTSFNITITNGTLTSQPITINPQTDTINDVVSKFNNAGVNVKANYDSVLDRFFLTTTNTGTASEISFTGSDQNGLNFLGGTLKLSGGITETSAGSGVYTSTPVNGQDAVFKLDGVALKEASNTFSISGVTYNLKGVSSGAAMLSAGVMDTTVGQSTNVSVSNDVDNAVSSIQSLVDSYNKILDELNSKLDETRYTDYPPLTDAQKTEMKDSDITLWNEKAKSGMLHHDSTITSLVYSMRDAFSNTVSGINSVTVSGASVTYNSAASIGITTGDYTEGGKLYLDTNKLKEALQADPDVLYKLFGASGTNNADGTTDIKTLGIAGRLYDAIKNTMDKINQKAGTTINAQYDTESSLAKEISDYDRQISDEQDRFSTMQSQYYKQYNALEVTIKQLNDQSSWFLSQLGVSSGG